MKLGRSVRYAMADLEAFVLAARRTCTTDPGRSAAAPLPPSISVLPHYERPSLVRRPDPSAAPAPRPKPR